ncbi:MAG: endonuclease domain-containing protein [Candidatus Cloacimonetes bacterium]|nr:endonuclease domain-containing protein [Candidatus Cloacimonadota bacterium]
MTEIFNKKSEKSKRINLRKNMTQYEKILWEKIRNKQISNLRFRRQYSIDKYVVDFFCPQLKLAIKIDGKVHLKNHSKQYDDVRQNEIESLGINFLRFSNSLIRNDIYSVIETIKDFKKRNNPSNSPS